VTEAIRFEGVSLWRTTRAGRKRILDAIDWTVAAGEHWGIVGPNGAGKTTMLRIASAQMRPSAGAAWVLGGRLGRVPLHELRRRIGLVEPGLGRRFYPEQQALEVVLTGLGGTILLVVAAPTGSVEQARSLLETVGAASLEARTFASCSEGERARILLARGLMTDAPLLALDEPAAGLDLGGRELLLDAFERTVAARPGLTTLTVTHHIEELPPSTSHALLIRDGRIVAAGPVAEALTAESLTGCFGLPLRVDRIDGRAFVRAVRRGSGGELHDRGDADEDDQAAEGSRRQVPGDACTNLPADDRPARDERDDPPVDV
jgi:iron complex transport system ATP-binding protein